MSLLLKSMVNSQPRFASSPTYLTVPVGQKQGCINTSVLALWIRFVPPTLALERLILIAVPTWIPFCNLWSALNPSAHSLRNTIARKQANSVLK
jgi:hypothetical protein